MTRDRLVPRWWTALVVLALLLGVVLGLVMALASDGAVAWSGSALAVAFAALFLSAVSALVRPRRPREPDVAPDGTRTFRAPAATVAGLLVAWAMLLVVAAGWAWLAVTDLDALESPGIALLTIIGALTSLPDLVRLLTGRLHRWTLELGPVSTRYRGYRTDVTVRTRDVKGAAIQRRNPAGVRIDLRGSGADVVVPITAFAVPAEQLVDEVHRARKAASAR